MGQFDHIRLSDPDPEADRARQRAAAEAARLDWARKLLTQVARDAAAVLRREGAPTMMTDLLRPRGRGERPSLAWNLGPFWVDGDGCVMEERSETISHRVLPIPYRSVRYLAYSDVPAMKGTMFFVFDVGHGLAFLNYDDWIPIGDYVAENIRRVLRGQGPKHY